MKRVWMWGGAVILILMAAATVGYIIWPLRISPPATAQRQDGEPGTKFERFLLKKGVVAIREYYSPVLLSGRSGRVELTPVRAYAPGDRQAVAALQVHVYGDERDRLGVLDSEELTSLHSAMPRLMNMFSAIKSKELDHTAQVDFKGQNVSVGFYVAKGAPDERWRGFFVQSGGSVGGTFVAIPEEKIPELAKAIADLTVRVEGLKTVQE